MDLKITPPQSVCGTVRISGSKNGALPLFAASILGSGKTTIEDAPDVSDIRLMHKMLDASGADVTAHGNKTEINPQNIDPCAFADESAGRIRGSFLLAGACLAKFGHVKISMPGGCPIGLRPIDLHLKGFASLGADISTENGVVTLKADRLSGADIYLDFPSVGATENIMIAASLADGKTVISNASAEPEICALADMLISMGAEIDGAGTDRITVIGKRGLGGTAVTAIPDRIEAGTYMMLAAAAKGKVVLENVYHPHLTPVTAKLREMGADIKELGNSISIDAACGLCGADIKTMPYPGFPTDMQAPFCALLCVCRGSGIVVETVFENRFLYVGELIRMGASIKTDGRTAVVEGGAELTGAAVQCRDLRGGAALIIAACTARGSSVIHDAEHILRGYADITNKLRALGCSAEIV